MPLRSQKKRPTKQRFEMLRKMERAAKIRVAGGGVRDVQEELGYKSISGAHDLLVKALDEFAPREKLDQWRDLQNLRLDGLTKRWSEILEPNGNDVEILEKATACLVKIWTLQSKINGVLSDTNLNIHTEGEVQVTLLQAIKEYTNDGGNGNRLLTESS